MPGLRRHRAAERSKALPRPHRRTRHPRHEQAAARSLRALRACFRFQSVERGLLFRIETDASTLWRSQTHEDIDGSKKAHEAIGAYYEFVLPSLLPLRALTLPSRSAKLAADQNLSRRTTFPWTILRPGHLLDDEPTGWVTAGKTGMGGVTVRSASLCLPVLLPLQAGWSRLLTVRIWRGVAAIARRRRLVPPRTLQPRPLALFFLRSESCRTRNRPHPGEGDGRAGGGGDQGGGSEGRE